MCSWREHYRGGGFLTESQTRKFKVDILEHSSKERCPQLLKMQYNTCRLNVVEDKYIGKLREMEAIYTLNNHFKTR